MNVHISSALNLESFQDTVNNFISRANNKTLTIGILGLGYVGLPLLQAFVSKGYRVQGFDINQDRVDSLNAGLSPFKHISRVSVTATVNTGLFEAISDFDRLDEPDAILICVPTPLNKYKEPDLVYVENSSRAIAKKLRPGQLIVLESTTWPGTCNEVMLPILESSGLVAGKDFGIAYSPEREDPGNVNFETGTIPKIVGADTDLELEMALAVYESIVPQVVKVKDLRTAEAVKVTENIFRWVNIGMVNELKLIFEPMGIDVWEVINGAATKPFGFMPFYPGPGVGGHCIPIDPYYLSWKAKEYGTSARFITLAGEINDYMPQYVIERTSLALNDMMGKAMSRSKILVVGLAYKENIDDPRESPSIPLISLLKERKADVHYYDSAIREVKNLHDHPEIEGMTSTPWSEDVLKSFDVAIIATAHRDVDYDQLCRCVPIIVDTRNVTHGLTAYAHKIVKA